MIKDICDRFRQFCHSIPDDIVAGAFAGIVARMLTAPFDVLKIRYQLDAHGVSHKMPMWTAVKTIVREEGVTALWKGNVPALFLWVSYAVAQFACYGWLKDRLVLPDKKDSKQPGSGKEAKIFLAGAIASTFATYSTYPFDIMRTQFAIQGKVKTYTSMNSFVSHTLKTKGFSGLFVGVGPAMISITPYMGLNFALYESLKSFVPVDSSSATAKTLQKGLMGGIAGGVSKFIVYPLDTVKKRMQAASSPSLVSLKGTAPTSLLRCINGIYREEGFKGFYKGLTPTLTKAVAATAVTFAAFEAAKDFLELSRKEREDKEKPPLS